MTKAERVRAALRGERPDRVPYALWSHFPGIDMDPVRLAEESWKFYKKLDIDLIKTMNNGMYPIEDFGCTVDYSEIVKGGVAKVVSTPIAGPEDWHKLTVCPCTQGSNARELRHLQLVLDKLKGEEVPVIFTVFFLWFPSGLVLYYIVSNLVTIIQQQLIYRGLEKRGLHSREKKKS